MENVPLLELHMHLASGNTYRFTQQDRERANQAIQQIHPRLFQQDVVSVYQDDQLIAFPGRALAGISVVIDPLPQGLQDLTAIRDLGIADSREITESDYQSRRSRYDPAAQPFTMLLAVEMISGHRFWIEEEAGGPNPQEVLRRPMFERHIVHTIFSRPPLVCRRLGGGVSLWNRSHMVSCLFYPSPAVPSPAIPANLA